jgi:hypothetical protein
MIGTLAAECLAIVTGIFPTHAPSENDVERAVKLHNKVQSKLREFLKAEKPEDWEKWERPPNQQELFDQLTEPLSEKLMESDVVPVEILAQWALVISKAREFLISKWPIFETDGVIPEKLPLSTDEYADLWSLVRAVDGIDNLFADLQSHCLEDAQIDAIRACYPDWYEETDKMIFDELVNVVSKKHVLTWQQEDMLRVFRSLPGEEPLTVTQPTATKKREKSPNLDRAINQARTPTERGEANAAE